ncbi:MAG: glycosyltransferase [Rickettsiales bacterium]|nr:glycosyltransferase [Rickettsiales bacterium]
MTPRAFRATELVKELAQKGHNVVFYSVLNDYDYSSITNTGVILKNLGKSILDVTYNDGNKSIGGSRMYMSVRQLIRTYTEYPAILLMPLVKKAIEQEGEIDYLITIAMPHPIHWGASYASLQNVKCWTADCGDPFMKNPLRKYPFYFKWIEKRWCCRANYITVPFEGAKSAYYEEFRDKIHVIPQGFDFSNVILSQYQKNNIPTFAYAGNILKKGRNITLFLDYLCTLKYNFKFIVYTRSLSSFDKYVDLLGEKLILNDFVSRENLLKTLSSMDFLINIKNESDVQKPSKLIDYYLSKRPILEIKSNFEEKQYFEEFCNGDYTHKMKGDDISEYDISNVADKFIELYDKNNKEII